MQQVYFIKIKDTSNRMHVINLFDVRDVRDYSSYIRIYFTSGSSFNSPVKFLVFSEELRKIQKSLKELV